VRQDGGAPAVKACWFADGISGFGQKPGDPAQRERGVRARAGETVRVFVEVILQLAQGGIRACRLHKEVQR
jgi:hypothetical protein